jgi:hypothetical protein
MSITSRQISIEEGRGQRAGGSYVQLVGDSNSPLIIGRQTMRLSQIRCGRGLKPLLPLARSTRQIPFCPLPTYSLPS